MKSPRDFILEQFQIAPQSGLEGVTDEILEMSLAEIGRRGWMDDVKSMRKFLTEVRSMLGQFDVLHPVKQLHAIKTAIEFLRVKGVLNI